MTAEPARIELPVVWVGAEDLPVQLASQFLAQIQAPNEVILTVGQTAPPVLLGTAEQQAAQAAAIPFVPVRSMVRLSLTTQRVRELLEVLTKTLDQHDTSFPT